MSRYLSIRLSSREEKFLENIARQHELEKSDGSLSLGRALKKILAEKLEKVASGSPEFDAGRTQQLLEQINVMVPQLIFKTTFTNQALAASMEQSALKSVRQEALEQTVKTCGQLQSEKYAHIFVGHDGKNMKTLPIEEEDNQWK